MPYKDPEARKRYIAEHYRQNRERILAYAKEYREAHPEEVSDGKKRIYHERYKADPAYKAKISRYQKQRRKENPQLVKAIEKRSRQKTGGKSLLEYQANHAASDERRARTTVNRAVRIGKLPRVTTLACVTCSGPAREYHHHLGYERANWLMVIPVCAQCHKDHHAALRGSPFAVSQASDISMCK